MQEPEMIRKGEYPRSMLEDDGQVTIGPELYPGDEGYIEPPRGTNYPEDYGIKRTFVEHLNLALQSMPPDKAFEAAQHATRQYLAGFVFKGDGAGGYHKLERRDEGGGRMK